MTVATTSSEDRWGGMGGVGQEDITPGDLRVPRLKIDNQTGQFEDGTSKAKFKELDVIVLGLVKQRTYFPDLTPETEGKPPICKSNDFSFGFPQDPENKTPTHAFPWQASRLDPNTDMKVDQETNLPYLPCEKCHMKEWGQKRSDSPPCNEVHSWPMLYFNPETTSW